VIAIKHTEFHKYEKSGPK